MPLLQPDFGDFIRKIRMQHTGNQTPKKPNLRKQTNKQRPDVSKPAAASKTVQPPSISIGPSSSAASTGGLCPLRKLLGPSLSSVIFTTSGHLQCPTPIIQARAMLAATPPIQSLRPQALPVKFRAVGALTAALNVPCGMWREHTEKFSGQWFLAVHASIPFIAMLRKAVIMPKIAIACTIACAVAGQAIGARLERERLAKAAAISLLPSTNMTTASEDLARLQTSARKAGRRKRTNRSQAEKAVLKVDEKPQSSVDSPSDGSPQWLIGVVNKIEALKPHFMQPIAVSS